MIDNQLTLSSIRMATSHSRSGAYIASKTFYDDVREQFLQDSARYLRSGCTRNSARPMRNGKIPVNT
jgi:hypothetical protein